MRVYIYKAVLGVRRPHADAMWTDEAALPVRGYVRPYGRGERMVLGTDGRTRHT